jgi:very-short-patch-repair endonuclease
MNQLHIEKKTWNALRNEKFHTYKFLRQRVIKGFVVDLYCQKLRLAVVVDGIIQERQKEYDEPG